MGYFQVRYNSRVVNYERRGFIRLATPKLILHPMLAVLCHLKKREMLTVPKLGFNLREITIGRVFTGMSLAVVIAFSGQSYKAS